MSFSILYDMKSLNVVSLSIHHVFLPPSNASLYSIFERIFQIKETMKYLHRAIAWFILTILAFRARSALIFWKRVGIISLHWLSVNSFSFPLWICRKFNPIINYILQIWLKTMFTDLYKKSVKFYLLVFILQIMHILCEVIAQWFYQVQNCSIAK